MKKLAFLGVLVIISALSVVSCERIEVNCEASRQEVQDLKILIEALAAASECSEDFECRSIAMGVKACGGPQKYLIYSTSIDTDELESLVATLNQKEATYNLDCGVTSDCDVPAQPVDVDCVDGECTPLF